MTSKEISKKLKKNHPQLMGLHPKIEVEMPVESAGSEFEGLGIGVALNIISNYFITNYL